MLVGATTTRSTRITKVVRFCFTIVVQPRSSFDSFISKKTAIPPTQLSLCTQWVVCLIDNLVYPPHIRSRLDAMKGNTAI
jgi:hypothetical protein